MNLHINKMRSCALAGLSYYVAWSALCLCSLVIPSMSAAQTGEPTIKREYFVRQGAGEALLIQVDAFEAEIEASIFAPERKLLLVSAFPDSRLVPLFQFVDSTDKPRQLDIEVTANQSTANSEFGIGITRLAIWDKRSGAVANAYHLLAFGMQKVEVDNAASWTVRINSLMNAGAIFDQYGMKELRLWTNYFAAHLIHYRLHDYNMVLGLSREILEETRASRWTDIELATQQLKSAALIGLRGLGTLPASASEPDPVQASLARVASLANSMGYRFEQAQAINQSGLEYVNQSFFPQALEQFQQALEIADSIGDSGLAKGIRESMAEIHAGQGDDPATSKVLQEIETRLAENGGGDELALNLLQQGRIYIRGYRYPQAIEVLSQALNFENDSSTRSQINIELAKAHHESGQTDAMLAYLDAADIDPRRAPTYFRQVYEAAIRNPASLRHDAETRYLRARSLARDGQRRQALETLDQLIDQVLFLRQAIPGVLGAWYWERHEDLINDYLGLQLADGTDSLLALSKIRYSTKPSESTSNTDSVRNLLAQRENAMGTEDLRATDSSINHEIAALRTLFDSNFKFLSGTGLGKHLRSLGANEAVLTFHFNGTVFYAWLASNGNVKQLELANPGRLSTNIRKAHKDIASSTGPAFESLMDDLGSQLLGPLAGSLPETVYVIPSGLLLGFPFDALRINKHYLLERHKIVSLLSFPSNPNPSAGLKLGRPERVFLAGDPQDFSGGYATRLETSAEIQAVINLFVGPGLNIIQGASLLKDEFQGIHFQQANLLHLTMPGVIDLGEPGLSELQLSESASSLGRTSLMAADIRTLKTNANLVYLDATQVKGNAHSSTVSQLGLVSDFLQAGANVVIARLWTAQGDSAENLLSDFYTRLQSSDDISTAMTGAKRQYLRDNNGETNGWATLQLFID